MPPHSLSIAEEIHVIREHIFGRKFKGLTPAQSQLVRNAIIKNVAGRKDMGVVIRALQKALGLEEGQAETIVRTEEHEIRSALRERAFKINDPDNEKLYEWIGPNDSRTTPICKAIKEQTKGGVKLAELKEIVQHEATKANKNYDARDWSPHINCRHSFVRVFK